MRASSTPLFLLLSGLLPGCYTAFAALDRLDGGAIDAGPRDAGRTADARADDARADDSSTPDAGGCAGGVRWIDTALQTVPIDTTIAPVLIASTAGFELLYQHAAPDLCDGPCPALVRIPTSGAASPPIVPYWARIVPAPAALFGGTDRDGALWFGVLTESTLRWRVRPETGDSATPTGSLEMDPRARLAGLVVRASDVLIATHAVTDDPQGFTELVVRRHTSAGVPGDIVPELDPTLSFDHWAPELDVAPDGTAWLGALQDWDFPPTAQLASESGTLGIEGSSCGLQSFDLAPENGAATLIVEDCTETVQVRRRTADREQRAIATTTRDTASVPVRSRIATNGEHVVTVHRGSDNLAHVTVLDRDLRVLATATVPASEASPAETFAGPLGIAAHADGTFAVLTTEVSPGRGEGEVMRFRACD